MKPPMIFFNCDCPQTGNARGVCPDGPALISDNRYFNLLGTPAVQLLGVTLGSNTQSFLTPAQMTSGSFVIIGPDGQARSVQQPAVQLLSINPLTDGSYPAPGGFQRILVATGADPAQWYFLTAPTAGSYILKSTNGTFSLQDAGSIPGVNEIGSSATFAPKGDVMVVIPTATDGVYIVRKLTVTNKRVLVGDVDGDGVGGYHALPDGTTLEHPLGNIKDFKFYTLGSTDIDGAPISGGFEQAVGFGPGATTDGIRLIYSPSMKRLYKAPDQLFSFTKVAIVTASTAIAATYSLLPNGHLLGPSVAINGSNVVVQVNVKFAADEQITLGLFRDGAVIQEFPLNATNDSSFFFADTGVPLGNHQYDVRWRRTVAGTANTAIVNYSSLMLTAP